MRAASHVDQLQEHTHDGSCACGEHHSHIQAQLVHTLAGLTMVFNSFLVAWLFKDSETVAGFSAMAGAAILGFPIVRVAFKDLQGGSLNTNVLVALAVVTLFASGHYPEAGIVSFFMLLGQIIERRTAEGALASIHSLIKLTPTKARRGSLARRSAASSLACCSSVCAPTNIHTCSRSVSIRRATPSAPAITASPPFTPSAYWPEPAPWSRC